MISRLGRERFSGREPGRYSLGITDIDLLATALLSRTFSNPERVSLPDIDIDFADNRRDEVIDYVKSTYGPDHVAQIITFGTMAARRYSRCRSGL